MRISSIPQTSPASFPCVNHLAWFSKPLHDVNSSASAVLISYMPGLQLSRLETTDPSSCSPLWLSYSSSPSTSSPNHASPTTPLPTPTALRKLFSHAPPSLGLTASGPIPTKPSPRPTLSSPQSSPPLSTTAMPPSAPCTASATTRATTTAYLDARMQVRRKCLPAASSPAIPSSPAHLAEGSIRILRSAPTPPRLQAPSAAPQVSTTASSARVWGARRTRRSRWLASVAGMMAFFPARARVSVLCRVALRPCVVGIRVL